MSVTNDLDWKDYEAITQYIYSVLGAVAGVKVKCYSHDCKVEGDAVLPKNRNKYVTDQNFEVSKIARKMLL